MHVEITICNFPLDHPSVFFENSDTWHVTCSKCAAGGKFDVGDIQIATDDDAETDCDDCGATIPRLPADEVWPDDEPTDDPD